MSNAVDAARHHIESWNTRDNSIIAQTMAYPFVQYDLDGSMVVYDESDELFDFDALDKFSTSLAAAEVVSSGPHITVVKIAFNWEYPNQQFVGIGNAVWGFEERDGEFLLRWRQFVGWHEGDA